MEIESLIYDEDEIRRFITNVLKPLEDDEVYILLLTARKKYSSVISTSQEVVQRDIIRNNDPERILRKIRKIANVRGIYADKNTGEDIPLDALVLYLLVDPRSMLKGYREFVNTIQGWTYDSLKGESKNLEYYRRLDVKLFSAIHSSRSRSHYSVIDVDKKSHETLAEISRLLKEEIKWTTATHGGFHIIANKNKNTGAIIYNEISKMQDVEILKNAMTPIPGTLQGGFRVVGI